MKKKCLNLNEQVNLRLPTDLLNRFDDICEENYMSRNSMMIQAIAKYCQNYEKEKRLSSDENIIKLLEQAEFMKELGKE